MSAAHANRQRPGLRLPPFGRELLELRRRGMVPRPHRWFGHVVVCLDAWNVARFLCRVVIPQDATTETFNFEFIAGLDVLLTHSPATTFADRLHDAIRHLLRFNPASLRVINLDVPANGFWVKSHAVGIERREFSA